MENHRQRILELVKKNIVSKLKGRNLQKKKLLNRELARNSSLFLNSNTDKDVAKEERDFILSILNELEWTTNVAKEHLERLNNVLLGNTDMTKNSQSGEKYCISTEKMSHFLKGYEQRALRSKREIQKIIAHDYSNGKFTILHERLWNTTNKRISGSRWSKEEIDFVVEKHNMGYSFSAIATILKRPERTVSIKYHENK